MSSVGKNMGDFWVNNRIRSNQWLIETAGAFMPSAVLVKSGHWEKTVDVLEKAGYKFKISGNSID